MTPYDYHRPRTLAEALRLCGEVRGARAMAGGTDLLVRIRQGRERPRAIVSLRSVAGLCGIDIGPETVAIGALTPVADLARDAGLAGIAPGVVEAARALGSVAIRNMATVGGNLANASPCADLAPPLLCAGARVRVQRPGGGREIAIDDFFLGPGATALAPGEIVTSIAFERGRGARSAFLKAGRVAVDLALASVAVRAEVADGRLRGVRVAAGAVAPTPVRLRRVEALLEDRRPSEEVVAEASRAAAGEVAPISDLRGSAGHRRRLVGALLARAIAKLVDAGTA